MSGLRKGVAVAILLGSRVITGDAMASTPAGVKLQADELHKQVKKAANALLTVAIIQTIFAIIIYFAVQNSGGNAVVAAGLLLAVAVVFWGLFFWARVNPLPAAIVGLVIYVTLWALDLLVWMMSTASSTSGSNPGGAGPFNGIVIKILIVVMLGRAIKAGAMHRKLLRDQQLGNVTVPT